MYSKSVGFDIHGFGFLNAKEAASLKQTKYTQPRFQGFKVPLRSYVGGTNNRFPMGLRFAGDAQVVSRSNPGTLPDPCPGASLNLGWLETPRCEGAGDHGRLAKTPAIVIWTNIIRRSRPLLTNNQHHCKAKRFILLAMESSFPTPLEAEVDLYLARVRRQLHGFCLDSLANDHVHTAATLNKTAKLTSAAQRS